MNFEAYLKERKEELEKRMERAEHLDYDSPVRQYLFGQIDELKALISAYKCYHD